MSSSWCVGWTKIGLNYVPASKKPHNPSDNSAHYLCCDASIFGTSHHQARYKLLLSKDFWATCGPNLHLGAMICMFAWIIYDPGLLALSAEVRFFKALGQNMVYPDGLLNYFRWDSIVWVLWMETSCELTTIGQWPYLHLWCPQDIVVSRWTQTFSTCSLHSLNKVREYPMLLLFPYPKGKKIGCQSTVSSPWFR